MGATNYQTARQAGVRRTFARLAAKGLLIAVTLQLGATAGTYDPASNADTGGGYTTTLPMQAFKYNATDAEAALGIGIGQEVLMIQGADLPAGAKPTEADSVLIDDLPWNIKQVASVPGEFIYLLSIQRA